MAIHYSNNRILIQASVKVYLRGILMMWKIFYKVKLHLQKESLHRITQFKGKNDTVNTDFSDKLLLSEYINISQQLRAWYLQLNFYLNAIYYLLT